MKIEQKNNNGILGFIIVDDEGEYFIDGTNEEIILQKYAEIKNLEANPPEPSIEVKRKKEYETQGITIDKLIVALWELVVEDRPESANALQAERVKVKQKYPKVGKSLCGRKFLFK